MILALQYYDGDLDRTMSLARLLADIEPRPRTDILLALVCQPGTPRPEIVTRTIAHCRRKLCVTEVVSEFGASGYPAACNALWRGTVSHFYREYASTGSDVDPGRHSSILTLDGGDGVPLHNDWIDRMISAHLYTLRQGKLITSTPYFLGTCPLHMNPNAVFHLDVFARTRLLDEAPTYADPKWANFAFDVYHRAEMLEHACPSSVVHTDWHGGGLPASLNLLRDRSLRSLWLHGYKDGNLYRITREHLVNQPPPPRIHYHEIDQLLRQEKLRRSFEKTHEEVPAARVHTPYLDPLRIPVP
jgi:hypothetical protein